MPSRHEDDALFQDFFAQKTEVFENQEDEEDEDSYYGSGIIAKTYGSNYNNTYYPKSTRRSGSGISYNSKPTIESELLRINHRDPDYERELQLTIKRIFKEYSTAGVAVMFKLNIQQKKDYDFQMSKFTAEDKLLILQKARTILRKSIFAISDAEYEMKKSFFRLVKFDDYRVFAFASNPSTAMKWILRVQQVVNDVETAKAKIKVSCGCEYGNIFELQNDYFGNPVNLASKLAEDVAEPGELLVSFGNDERIEAGYIERFPDAKFVHERTRISGVEISYYIMTRKGLEDVVALCCGRNNEPNDINPSVTRYFSPSVPVEVKRQKIIMVQSDLSGFTRLSKKYNVLHYLTLILHYRRIFKQCMETLHKRRPCSLFKFQGDNIVCKFEDMFDAIMYVTMVNGTIARYNTGKHPDYQIDIKFSIAQGSVIVTRDKDIVGMAWDECCTLAEYKAKIGEISVTQAVKNNAFGIIRNLGYDFIERRGTKVKVYYNLVYQY